MAASKFSTPAERRANPSHMSATARFIVTMTLAWATFIVLIAIANAAPLHGCTGTAPTAVAALAVAAASVGACLGFLAAALLHVGEGRR
jgi:hypothetical protein